MSASTPLPLPLLRRLLLDLISSGRQVGQAQVDALAPHDWERLLVMVRMHRLGALLHWQLGRTHVHLRLPEVVTRILSESHQKSILRNLGMQRELVMVHRILEKAGIAHVALKGAGLAFHVYPQAGLRSLRDLDFLVPREQVQEAYRVLLENGLTRMNAYAGQTEAPLELAKHMPPIASPSGNVSIELHYRLFHQREHGKPDFELSDDPDFWQRLIPTSLAGTRMNLESPTDLLFHLIVHAVHDHEFNNGPLLLPDLAFLLEAHAIDWPLFWHMAKRREFTRGCCLALQLMEKYWGKRPISWPDDVAANMAGEDQLDVVAQLMLREIGTRGVENVLGKSSHSARVRHMLRKVFPTQMVIAAAYPAAAGASMVYATYPVYWWKLLRDNVPAFWRARQDLERLGALRQWIVG